MAALFKTRSESCVGSFLAGNLPQARCTCLQVPQNTSKYIIRSKKAILSMEADETGDLNHKQRLKARDLWDQFSKGCPVRFKTFEEPEDADALNYFARYAWNVGLCQSLVPILSAAEVVLRNGIDKSMQRGIYQRQWWDDHSFKCLQTQLRQVKSALRELEDSGNLKPTPDDIVAALSFNFWTCLLDAYYEPSVWKLLLQEGLPHIPASKRDRTVVQGIFDDVRKLRNRALHNKPIFRALPAIRTTYVATLDAIGWFNPRYKSFVVATSSFGQVCDNATKPYRKQFLRVYAPELSL